MLRGRLLLGLCWRRTLMVQTDSWIGGFQHFIQCERIRKLCTGAVVIAFFVCLQAFRRRPVMAGVIRLETAEPMNERVV